MGGVLFQPPIALKVTTMNENNMEEIVRDILNPEPEGYRMRSWSLLGPKRVNEINIVDLKGKKFKFPGTFLMTEENGTVTFKAVKD